MYFAPILILIVIVCVIGGIVAGGAFTLVLVPIAVIAAIIAAVNLLFFRAVAPKGTTAAEDLEARKHAQQHPEEMTPDELVSARRAAQ